MKILLAGINSRYTHQNLAIWSLKANCNQKNVYAIDYNINQNIFDIYSDILQGNYDVIGLSCYIWNIEMALKLIADIKKARPQTKIVLGGPEVSFNSEQLMENNDIDYIIAGEGETAFCKLLSHFNSLSVITDIPNLYYRDGAEIRFTYSFNENLDLLISPYNSEMIKSAQNKIIYFESSRGCDFNCLYCLSSADKEFVRYLDVNELFDRVNYLTDQKISIIKFVDRTFNSNKLRCKEILSKILEDNSAVKYHFEMAADLLDEELLDIMANLKNDKIQIECGIQSTNNDTLSAINRAANLKNISRAVSKIKEKGNIHIHLDLIVGLPYEGLESFEQSFNNVYALQPDMLQVGFLKHLKGTKIGKYYTTNQFRHYPPYEVIQTDWLSAGEVNLLKKLDRYVDLFYNSGFFCFTMQYLFTQNNNTYNLYLKMIEKIDLQSRSYAKKELFDLLFNFGASKYDKDLIADLIKYDYLLSDITGDIAKVPSRFIDKQLLVDLIKNHSEKFGKINNLNNLKSKYKYEIFDYDIDSYEKKCHIAFLNKQTKDIFSLTI